MKSPFGTFGYFQVGLPLIFVRADLLATIDPNIWRLTGKTEQPFPNSAVGAKAKIHHEIKHFHDALLNPYLFSEFIFCIAQSVLTLFLEGAKNDASERAHLEEQAEQLKSHQDSLRPFFLRYTSVGNSSIAGDLRLLDFLEVMAVCVEAVSILRNREQYGGENAREKVDQITTKRYRKIIHLMIGSQEYTEAELVLLHDSIFHTLIHNEDPIHFICHCIDQGRLREVAYGVYVPPSMGDHEPPRRFIEFPRITMPESSIVSSVMVSCEEMEDLRHSLCKKHFEKLSSLIKYLDCIEDLPLPPTCFYSDDQTIDDRTLPFITRSKLIDRYGDAFSLGDFRNENFSTTISSAIIPTLNSGPCVAIPKVHSTMAFRYISQDLFGDSLTFSQHIDRSISEAFISISSK